MYNPLVVCRLQAVCRLNSDVECLVELQRPLRYPVLHRPAFEIGHGEERLPVYLVDFVDGADVLVIKTGGGFRFSDEPGSVLRVFDCVSGEEL